jgi:hypothetical protein
MIIGLPGRCLQDGSIVLEEFFHTGGLADLQECRCGGDAELIKMTMLLFWAFGDNLQTCKLKTQLNLSVEKATSMR